MLLAGPCFSQAHPTSPLLPLPSPFKRSGLWVHCVIFHYRHYILACLMIFGYVRLSDVYTKAANAHSVYMWNTGGEIRKGFCLWVCLKAQTKKKKKTARSKFILAFRWIISMRILPLHLIFILDTFFRKHLCAYSLQFPLPSGRISHCSWTVLCCDLGAKSKSFSSSFQMLKLCNLCIWVWQLKSKRGCTANKYTNVCITILKCKFTVHIQLCTWYRVCIILLFPPSVYLSHSCHMLYLLIPVLKFTVSCSLIIQLPAGFGFLSLFSVFMISIWTTHASRGLTYISRHSLLLSLHRCPFILRSLPNPIALEHLSFRPLTCNSPSCHP